MQTKYHYPDRPFDLLPDQPPPVSFPWVPLLCTAVDLFIVTANPNVFTGIGVGICGTCLLLATLRWFYQS